MQNTSLQAILHFDRNYLALSLQTLSVSVMKKYSGTYYYTTTFFVLRSFKSHLCVLARRYSPNSLTSPSHWAVKVIFLLLSYQLHCLDVPTSLSTTQSSLFDPTSTWLPVWRGWWNWVCLSMLIWRYHSKELGGSKQDASRIRHFWTSSRSITGNAYLEFHCVFV